MIDDKFLKMLVDPMTKEPLRHATSAELASVNAAITRGLKNTGGQPVKDSVQEGLIPEKSGKRLYPVRDGIPLVLYQESLPLE